MRLSSPHLDPRDYFQTHSLCQLHKSPTFYQVKATASQNLSWASSWKHTLIFGIRLLRSSGVEKNLTGGEKSKPWTLFRHHPLSVISFFCGCFPGFHSGTASWIKETLSLYSIRFWNCQHRLCRKPQGILQRIIWHRWICRIPAPLTAQTE